MQRLVYTPKVYAFTKRHDGTILDISNYIVSGSVNRRTNAVSNAELTLRNPKMIFTDPDPDSHQVAFTPMDPITIYLRRLRNRPVRVFTGYLDKTPYLQLYPGTIQLRASCTLKRLLYTFFDPALPYTQNFFMAYGWAPTGSGTWFSQDALNDWKAQAEGDKKSQGLTKDPSIDASISNLLFATMKYIGRWDPSDIFIERLPKDLFTRLSLLSQEFTADNEESWAELKDLMTRVIGSSDYGNGNSTDPNSGTSGPVGSATGGPERFRKAANAAGAKYGIDPAILMGIAQIESGFGTNNGPSSAGAVGPMQFLPSTWASVYPQGDINNVEDAVMGAAKYLHDSGAPQDYHKAILAYNHAEWYVTQVLTAAAKYGYPTHSPLAPLSTPGGLAGAAVQKTITSGKASSATTGKLYRPIAAAGSFVRGFGIPTTTSGRYHIHSGVDYAVPAGTPCVAPTDGVITFRQDAWSDGGMVHFKFTSDVGSIKAGTIIGWGHCVNIRVNVGDKVVGGTQLADSGNPGGGPHVHFIARNGDDGGGDGSIDPWPMLQQLQKGSASFTSSSSSSGSIPAVRGPVFMEGDSLAVGTAAGLKTALNTKVTTKAAVGRSSTVGANDLITNKNLLTQTVIIQLGTNDTNATTFGNNIDKIMGAIDSAAKVFWVNVRRKAPADGSTDSALNQKLADAAKKYSNLTILDWAGAVDGGIALAADGIHPASYPTRTKFISDTVNSAIPTSGDTSGGTGSTSVDSSNPAGAGVAGAFFGSLNLPGLLEVAEAQRLGGEKSLLNDKPLMPFIQQLCEASLRQFMSTPDGKFFAFYPDYFGEMNSRPPYWEIDDIEVMDGGINLSDDSLVTHEYVIGDTINPLAPSEQGLLRSVFSSGVVTIFNAFMSDDVLARQDTAASAKAKKEAAKKAKANATVVEGEESPRGLDILLDREEAANFLQRYGARPNAEDMPMIKHPFFEMFLAYQRFMLAWSKQFESLFTFTFMPELFPGGKVGFPDHGLQMYIEEVTHAFDYTSGFTTQAVLSAPSVYGGNPRDLPPNMVKAIIEPIVAEKIKGSSTKGTAHANLSHLSIGLNK